MSQPETGAPTPNVARETATPPNPVASLSPLAGFLSYLVPGLGQIVQGRIAKGVFFMVVLLGMFHAGQAMAGWKSVYLPIPLDQAPDGGPVRRSYNPASSIINYRWHYAGQFFIGISAWPAIWQFFELPTPSEQSSAFLHDYQREPMYREKQILLARLQALPDPDALTISPEGELNRAIVRGDKTMDIGWIYTVIAGVLNILVIYDAVAGPAFGARFVPKTKTDKPQAEVVQT